MGSIPIDSTFDNSRYESEGSVAEYDSRPIEEDQNGARIWGLSVGEALDLNDRQTVPPLFFSCIPHDQGW